MEKRVFDKEIKFESRNQKDARELVIERNANIEYFEFKDSKGVNRTFATCGGRQFTMYVTPPAREVLNDTSLSDDEVLDKLQYFECCDQSLIGTPNEKWVPCLAIIGNRAPAKRVLGANLLRK